MKVDESDQSFLHRIVFDNKNILVLLFHFILLSGKFF